MAKKKQQKPRAQAETMATRDEQLQILADELNQDPLGRGYASMTDAQVVDESVPGNMNTRDRPTKGGAVSHNELWADLIVEAEWDALDTVAQDYVLARTNQYPEPWGVDHRFYEEVARTFPGGSQTRINMNNRAVGQQSRGEELGLPRPVKEGWVTKARAL